MSFPASELILNPDGSIYHLHLKPGEIANTVITVGDPERVSMVSNHFDTIEVKAQHREFKTHTGTLNGKRFTVLSTGIGAGNIDIAINELDALVNIDFETRKVKSTKKTLKIIRIGTSGAIKSDIPMDSFLVSDIAIGFDNLLHFYDTSGGILLEDLSENLKTHSHWNANNALPYAVEADSELLELFSSSKFVNGITATNIGFYGPQGRILRGKLYDTNFSEKLTSFEYKGKFITNLEMETAAIYGMAKLLGHKAVSLNAILANRALGSFSKNPNRTIEELIIKTFEILTQ